MSGAAVHLGQQGLELRAIDVRRRLALGLVDKSPELVGVYAGLPLHADIRQLPVHVGTESDELPYERLLDLALVGCGLVAAPRAEAGKKDERRAHDPNPPHGSSIRPSGIGWLALGSGGGPGEASYRQTLSLEPPRGAGPCQRSVRNH